MNQSSEKRLINNSQQLCGIDEAGRGALAGPLVAAAVITTIPITTIARVAKTPVRDSKTLSFVQRSRIYQAMQKLRIFIYTEIISVPDINQNGIGWANKEAMKRLVSITQAHHYILDGKINLGPLPDKEAIIESIVHADAMIDAVILAGIAAKATRDTIMQKIHQEFPQYGWYSNKGYGTKYHIEALRKHNSCPYHRLVFVATALGH